MLKKDTFLKSKTKIRDNSSMLTKFSHFLGTSNLLSTVHCIPMPTNNDIKYIDSALNDKKTQYRIYQIFIQDGHVGSG
jgi:hypothetical protein